MNQVTVLTFEKMVAMAEVRKTRWRGVGTGGEGGESGKGERREENRGAGSREEGFVVRAIDFSYFSH